MKCVRCVYHEAAVCGYGNPLVFFYSDNSRLRCFKCCFYRCICFTAICMVFILIIKSFQRTVKLSQKQELPQEQEEPGHVCGKHPDFVMKSVPFNCVDSHQSAQFLIQTSATGSTDGALRYPCRQPSEPHCYMFHFICQSAVLRITFELQYEFVQLTVYISFSLVLNLNFGKAGYFICGFICTRLSAHSDYVIVIAYTRLQWLRERGSLLPYMFSASVACVQIDGVISFMFFLKILDRVIFWVCKDNHLVMYVLATKLFVWQSLCFLYY